jgi:uncharacterized protein
LGDFHRISQAIGTSDFVVFKHYSNISLIDTYDTVSDPNWVRYVTLPGNFIRLLKMDNTGNCVFLSDNGCGLSDDTRPLVCRLYPYNFNELRMLGLVKNEDMLCPLHLLQEGETLIDRLQMQEEQANQWRILFYDELRSEYNQRENKC